MLSQERWRRLEALFYRAIAMPVHAREEFVREATGADPELLRELRAMLAVEAEATIRLRAPLREVGRALQTQALEPGARCGAWAVESVIGEGGMGRVYLGQRADGAYEQRVAIKMMASSGLDAQQRALFEFECRMQAQMQHPAIAQIYDAGLHDDDHPFLVMEYIEGQTIDQWCSSGKVSLASRVELLIQACRGIRHAHQKGVIHRDIKPRNVLVCDIDGHPQPKVIDFGIASAVAGDNNGSLAGTPGYMSPEQRSGVADIDARADVYSLGALLYELLMDQRPPDYADEPLSPRKTLLAMPRAKQKALALSRQCWLGQFHRALVDGLDAIVTKATEPETADRYDSVSSMLADLERWRRDLPPALAASGRWLVARKFLQRHRLPVAAAFLVIVCLLGGLTASLWALAVAHKQQTIVMMLIGKMQRALAFQQLVWKNLDVDAMGHVITTAYPQAGDPEANVAVARDMVEQTLVKKGLVLLDRELSDDPAMESAARESIARMYMSLENYPEAVTQMRKVKATLDALPPMPRRSALAIHDLGEALYRQGNYEQAWQVLAHEAPQRPKGDDSVLWLQLPALKGRVMLARGHALQALEFQEALIKEWAPKLGAKQPDILKLKLNQVQTLMRLGRHAEARRLMAPLLPMFQRRFGNHAAETLEAMMTMADLLNENRQYGASLRLAYEVRLEREYLIGEHRRTLEAMAMEGADKVHLAQGPAQMEAAEAFMRSLVKREQHVLGEDDPVTLTSRADLAWILAAQHVPAKSREASAMRKADQARRLQMPGTPLSPGSLSSIPDKADQQVETGKAPQPNGA